jgi:hypothetical protein
MGKTECQPAMHREKWDDGEIEFLRANCFEHDIPWIAEKLKRTRASIVYKITKLKMELGPWGLNRAWKGIRVQVPRPSAAQLKHGVRLVNLFTLAEYVATGGQRGEGNGLQVEVVSGDYGNGGECAWRTFWVYARRVALVSIFQKWYPRRNIERRERIRAAHAAKQGQIPGGQGQSGQGHARV